MSSLHPELHRAGFTLLEVLVAFVVSGIILTVIAASVQMATKRQQRNHQFAAAAALGQARIDMFTMSPLTIGNRNGRSGELVWQEQEDIAVRDRRGLFVLARLRLSIVARGAIILRADRLTIKEEAQ